METGSNPRNPDWSTYEELEEAYGYCGHRCVLYASSGGEIIPGDFVWYHIDRDDYTAEGHQYRDLRPVAIVISHSGDKYYRDKLQEALLIPSNWSYEVLWRDEEWFAKNKGHLVRHLGWQDGMRGAPTTNPQYIEIDEAQYNAGYEEGEQRKAELERRKSAS